MSEEIFSSTGSLGREVRQDDRLYENGDLYAMRPIVLAECFLDLREDPRSQTENVTRWILRGVVNDETMSEIQADRYGLRQHLEVAMPLAELGCPGWLIYLAQNASSRQAGLAQPDEMVAATTSYPARGRSAVQHVKKVVDSTRLEIRTAPNSEDADQLGQAMWCPGFGWSDEEVDAIIERLQTEQELPPDKRQLFFAGLYSGGLLVGAAMAETLNLPTPHGKLPLVENTEWYMQESHRGKGLMAGVLAALNAQIVRTFFARGEQPLVYAECNFTSRSDRAGYAAGFRIPPRFANQTLMQHVAVNDGIKPTGLRDFSFMYLPQAAFYENSGYNARQIDQIMSTIEKGVLV